MMMIYDEIT